MHIRDLIFNPKWYIKKIIEENCKQIQIQNVYRNGGLAAFTKHPGSDLMNAGATDVVMCQARFMKHLLFFLNTVEFWPLVSCPAGCYLSWDVPGLQLFHRKSRVSTCHMGINSQSSCFAHLYFLVPTGVR